MQCQVEIQNRSFPYGPQKKPPLMPSEWQAYTLGLYHLNVARGQLNSVPFHHG